MNFSRQRVRLIIPLWGVAYAKKLTTMTLPAVLAPNNLPALCEKFDVDVVLVTEQKLFAEIGASASFQKVSALCATRFVSLDDLMTGGPSDYGPILTCALFRGFADLGEKMKDTYLLFLNADFIIADGSYRHLGELMLQGHRVIHAPSFRVSLEDIWPKLQERIDGSVLQVGTRAMVSLALEHRHLTVHARTVTQRLYHQSPMDQFYWCVNKETLIGYQWPVALVAIKPERVVSEPVLVWDYGFIPEAAPTLQRYFIDDSDDFFMLEPQKKATGDEMIRLGTLSADDIAKSLSVWTTKEQRECGQQLLTIHADELPPDLEVFAQESRRYMREITTRLSPQPQPHIGHGMLGAWFDGVMVRIKSNQQHASLTPPAGSTGEETSIVARLLRSLHDFIFSKIIFVYRWHPLWLDTHEAVEIIERWKRHGQKRILWLTARDSFFRKFLDTRIDPSSLTLFMPEGPTTEDEQYDYCFCELTPFEVVDLQKLYRDVRARLRDGGEIVFNIYNPKAEAVGTGTFTPYEIIFPAPNTDASSISFHGTALSTMIRQIYFVAARSNTRRPALRAAAAASVLMMLAPLTWISNMLASARDPHIYTPNWTTTVVKFQINKRREKAASLSEAASSRAA